jgi:predicted GH43/DUF377 family glycosyl hydrolase
VNPIPSILNQGVPVKKLLSCFHSYNSGTHDGKRFCSRVYDPQQKRARLIWQRRIHNELIVEEELDIAGKGSFEDGRVFRHEGRFYVAFTEGIYEKVPFLSIQQVARLGADWQPEEKVTIPYGGNISKSSEKNWQFFSHEGSLFFVYSIVPHIVVELDNSFRPVNEYRSELPLHWPWGEILRGGTPPIRRGDWFLTFFHSHAAHRERDRRYAMGAYMFEAKPPFAIKAISPALLRASEQDETLPNPSVPGWKPIVVFPVGLWEEEEFKVALGVNDSFDAIAEFPEIHWQDPGTYSKPKMRYFLAENGPMPLMNKAHAIPWKLRRLRSPFYPQKGYMATADPNIIALIENRKDTKEISEREFNELEAGK